MSTELVIAIIVIVVFVAALVNRTLRLMRRSRELERKVDRSKLRKWEDDDD